MYPMLQSVYFPNKFSLSQNHRSARLATNDKLSLPLWLINGASKTRARLRSLRKFDPSCDRKSIIGGGGVVQVEFRANCPAPRRRFSTIAYSSSLYAIAKFKLIIPN